MFLPVLVKKAVGEKGHIKDMSQEVLTVMANHCGYNRVFERNYALMQSLQSSVVIKTTKFLT